MTATVPDPRFRDQLAEALECANWCNSNYPSTGGGLSLLSPTPGCDCLETHRLPQADALLPLVEARVQATANQRAAGAMRRAAETAPVMRFDNGYPVRAVPVSDLLSFAAVLASPAPAPHAEEGQQ